MRAGEVVGLAGLMGAGRTELARSIFGHSYGVHERGEVRIDGRRIKANSVPEAIDSGIAYLSEDRKMLGLNLLELIHESVVSAKPSKIKKGAALDIELGKRYAEEYRENLRIKAPSVMTGVSTLSGGNQQKVVLAKWLATKPDVLILNGPTVGVDIGSKYTIHSILQRLAKEGMAIVIISDDIAEVLTNCSSVLIMRGGRICESIDPATTSEAELGELVSRDAAPEGAK